MPDVGDLANLVLRRCYERVEAGEAANLRDAAALLRLAHEIEHDAALAERDAARRQIEEWRQEWRDGLWIIRNAVARQYGQDAWAAISAEVRRRPGKYGTHPSPRVGVVLETPAWDLTVFKVHFGLLTLKGCTKGARVLRFEAITHNTRQLGCGRALERFPQIVARLAGMCQRFCTALDCVDIGFIPGGTLDQLPLPAHLGASRVGGIDVNKPRIRAALAAVLALAASPGGFTVADMTARVHAMTGQAQATYNTRQAAYDLRKLRGKQLVAKPARTRRYCLPGPAARTISALLTLRDHVIAPILAGVQIRLAQPRPGQADPHRPGLRTPPNRHGHPVPPPGHPARPSRGITSANPNFWRSWNLKQPGPAS